MAIDLSITDGTTTVTLANGTTSHPLEYTPVVAAASEATVEEPCLMFWGTTTGGRQALEDLGRLFDQARRYAMKKVGPRVYVQHRPDGAEVLYRSLLVDGTPPLSDNVYRNAFGGNFLEAPLRWKRLNFWEPAAADTAVPLTNGNGSANTSGLTVWNHDDADSGHDNYVAISGANIGGALPAPVKLEITNTFNDTLRASRFYIGQMIFNTPGSFGHVLEGEDSTGGGVVTVSAISSGGNYMARTWTGSSEVVAYRWTIPSGTLNATAGNYYRVLARLALSAAYVPPLWVRVKVQAAGNYTIWEGKWVLAGAATFQSLDSVQLPPWIVEVNNIAALDLVIEGRRDDAGSTNFYLDFVQLLGLDGWRELRARAYGLQYNETLVDDGIVERLYLLNGSNAYGLYVGTGRLMLLPGRDQRLYFLHGDWMNGGGIARTLSVKAWYRPRRLSIEV